MSLPLAPLDRPNTGPSCHRLPALRTAAAQRPCWVCGSTNSRRFKPRSIARPLAAADLKITDAAYGTTLGLRRCAQCDFVFAEDDDLRELTSLYERLEDPGYEASQDARRLQMQWLLRRTGRIHRRAKTLLDIGAGSGLLVAEARRAGYEALGVEPSRALVEAARRINGVDLLLGVHPHPALRGRRFDLIFLVDVIEHVSDPLGLMAACRAGLADDGVLVVVTPDIGSLAARLLGHRWWHMRLAHVGYFNRRSMRRMIDRCGLRVIDRARPTWFFRAEYLADRLTHYLPVGRLNRLAGRSALLRRLYQTVVPVNPRDSMYLALRRAA